MPEAVPAQFQKYFILEKYDPFQGLAVGIATGQKPDRDNEELDYVKSKPYFEAWSESVHKDSGGKSFGNVRLQHSDKSPVGKLNAIHFDDEQKCIRVEAKIIEPVAKEMLEHGVLTGFSIGGSYIEKSKPDARGITMYVADPCEISVVDRPAYPEATFESVKSDGSVELKKFAKYEETKPEVKPATVEKQSDEPVAKPPVKTEEPEAPSAEKALADAFKLVKANIAAGDVQLSNEQISELLESLEKTMADKDKDLVLDKAARHTVHQKIQALKAKHTEFLGACKAHHDEMQEGCDGISKVIGGGPESMDVGGQPGTATHPDPDVTPQPPKVEIADKGMKLVSMGKNADGVELFKKVPINPNEIDLDALALKTAKIILEVQAEAIKKANREDSRIGDRSKAIPFVKAATKREDSGGGDDVQKEDEREEMSDQDKADCRGERGQKAMEVAMLKAQRCTANNWQAVPSRIANRASAGIK